MSERENWVTTFDGWDPKPEERARQLQEKVFELTRQLDEARGDAVRMRELLARVLPLRHPSDCVCVDHEDAAAALTGTPAAPAPGAVLDPATVEACAELVEGEPYGESVHTIAARIRALASSREEVK